MSARKTVLLSVAFLLAFSIRVYRVQDILYGEGIVFRSADTYYHLRQIEHGLENGFRRLAFDPYMDFPHGAENVLPPLFDLTCMLAGRAAQLIAGSEAAGSVGIALVPPLLGALTVLAVYWCGALLLGEAAGLIAAWVYSFLFGGVWVGLIGKPDHHVAESLLTALLIGITVTTYRALLDDGGGGKPVTGRLRGRLLRAVLLGVALGGAPLFWRGAVVVQGLVTGILALVLIHGALRGVSVSRTLGFLGLSYGIGTAILLAFGLRTPWGMRGEAVFYALSLFQPGFLLACGLGMTALVLLMSRLRKRRSDARYARRLLAGLGLCVLLVILGARGLIWESLSKGILFLATTDPWMASIQETQPIFRMGGRFSTGAADGYLGRIYWLFPLMPLLLYRRRRNLPREEGWIVLSLWLLLFSLMTLSQARYVHQLSVVTALIYGLLALELHRLLRDWLERGRRAGVIVSFQSWPLAGLASLAVLAAVLQPMMASYSRYLDRSGFERVPPENLVETLYWIRDHTPPTSGFRSPDRPPEYGVMALWDNGNWIVEIAERPVVASNFGFLHRGLIASLRVFLTRDAHQVVRLMEENRARYLLLEDCWYRLPSFHEQLRSYVQDVPPLDLSRIGELAVVRLYYHDGAPGGAAAPGLDRFRLVHESPPGMKLGQQDHPEYKLFELVTGAEIEVRGSPNEPFRVECPLITDQGRSFVVSYPGRLSPSGEGSVRVPYCTDPTGAVRATAPFQWICAERILRFLVPEEAVLAGHRISIDSSGALSGESP